MTLTPELNLTLTYLEKKFHIIIVFWTTFQSNFIADLQDNRQQRPFFKFSNNQYDLQPWSSLWRPWPTWACGYDDGLQHVEVALRQLTGQGAPETVQGEAVLGEAFSHDDAGHEDDSFQLPTLDRLLARIVQDTDTIRIHQRLSARF